MLEFTIEAFFKKNEILIDPIGNINTIYSDFKLHNLTCDFTNVNASEFIKLIKEAELISGRIKKSDNNNLFFEIHFDKIFKIKNIFVYIDLDFDSYSIFNQIFFSNSKIVPFINFKISSEKFLDIRNSFLKNEKSHMYKTTEFRLDLLNVSN